MRPDASKKLAAIAPKGSLSRALIGSVIAGVVIAGVVIAILIGNGDKASDGGSGSSALPAGVVGGKGGGILANTAGITGGALTTWQKCTSSGQHAQYVTDVQTSAEKAGVFDTPTVKLNGENVTKTLSTPDALAAQIKAATT
ncbi:MAG: DsbA family protein [Dermatophilaceae bacterium]